MDNYIWELGSTLEPHIFHVAREILKGGVIQEAGKSCILYFKL